MSRTCLLCIFIMEACLCMARVNDSGSVHSLHMRPLSPDRPHQTESPYTVDPGHFLLESDLLNFQKDRLSDSIDFRGTGIFFFNAKFGISRRSDVELISGTFQYNHYSSPGLASEKLYFPDFIFRYKYNLMGNDSGSTAIAVMPTIKTSDFFRDVFKVREGQLLLLAEKDFGERVGLGYTGGLSSFAFQPFLRQCEFFSTVSFDYCLMGALHHFVEISYRYGKYNEYVHNYSFDSGLTFTLSKNLQFDTGFYYFIPGKQPFLFIGGSFRI